MAFGTVSADVIQTSTSGGILGAGNASIMKNRIINGAMVINQRGFSGSITSGTNNVYTLDRWKAYISLNDKFTVSQNAGSVTPPVGFTNYLGATSSAATTPTSSAYYLLSQFIEGYNVADLGFGTANAKTITVSFWVRSSLTGTFGGSITNDDQDRSYPFTYTIASANTWTQASVTIAGDTTGNWTTTNGTGLKLWFSLGTGSSFLGTAGAWGSATYFSATGSTNLVATNGATFYITGVQLEVGSSATGFEYRNYGTELANCQRYYETSGYGMMGIGNSSTGIVCGYSFKVPKRAAPTMGLYTTSQIWPEIGVANRTSSSVTIGDAALVNTDSIVPRIEGFSGINTNASLVCYTPIAFTFSAEL